jgi:DNA-directed RNA polymerase subunit RPC12/RpoP
MAEFKFSCPQCTQKILCDSSYAGSQINCPVCQRAILVPPITPSAADASGRMVRTEISTWRTVAILGAGILAAAGMVVLAVHLLAGPKTVTFKAWVDGVDVVKLSGKGLWIEHQDFQPPGKMSINRKNWNPVWEKNTSAPYDLNPAFKPRSPESVKLIKGAGRGIISIVETPTPANDETLAVQLDDGGEGGADWYEFTISW